MERAAIVGLAIQLMDQYGLFAKGWQFDFNRRLRDFGVCDYAKRTIFLSEPLSVQRTPENVRHTLLHEIAHALLGPGYGHGRVWMRQAIALGISPERCGSAAREGLKVPFRYVGTCPNGHTMGRMRLPKGRRSCARCSSRYDERYVVTWGENEEKP